MRWVVLAAALTWGCGSESDAVALERSGVVYGADDRLEYFETRDPALREIWASSMVALIAKTRLDPVASAVASTVPTVGTVYGLCEGEPFSLQPSAAFCSGTLVGRDLVLTAGHCAHALAVRDFSVVLGYYEVEANQLALGAGAIVDVLEVVMDTDTSVGSSGGAAFNQSLAVQGVFKRGATDFEPSEAGCNRTILADTDQTIWTVNR